MAMEQQTLNYWMKKTGGRKNAAYTLLKRQRQAIRRGGTTTMTPTTTKNIRVTNANTPRVEPVTASPNAGGTNIGQAAATVATAGAVGAGAFGLARHIRNKERVMADSAARSIASQKGHEAKRRRAAARKGVETKRAKAAERLSAAKAKAAAANPRGAGAAAPRVTAAQLKGDAPSAEARKYGGGKFGGNAKPPGRR